MKKGIAAVCLSLLLTALSSLGAGENLILVKEMRTTENMIPVTDENPDVELFLPGLLENRKASPRH